MGIHRMSGNKKKTKQQKRIRFKHRMKNKDRIRDLGIEQTQGDIQDPELITAHILRKRRTSPKANITLSGKKKRKLIKQLRNMEKDKLRSDAPTVEETIADTTTEVKLKKEKFRDVEMSETPGEKQATDSGSETEDMSEEDDVDMEDDNT